MRTSRALPLPGETVTIPPLTPLLPGRPMSYIQSPDRSYSPAVAITASERRATGAPPSGRPAPMPRRPLPRSLTRVHVWLDEDGFTTDEAGERAFLTYAAIEGALVFAKAQRSAEPIERVHAQLPSVLRRNSKDRRRT